MESKKKLLFLSFLTHIHFLFFLLFICVSNDFAFAQNLGQMTVSGVITDNNKETMPGVNIVVAGTAKGVISDFNGEYKISVKKGDVLVFSFVGYNDYKVKVGNSRTINVVLQEHADVLDEVVVVGYATQKRSSMVGSVSDVSGKELLKTGLPNLSQAIQDALPGMIVTQSSGRPGSDDASLVVRGAGTFSGSNSPLILVDGIETSSSFSQIDPSEVASISLLKDAAATAVYGVRGANGVVLITTRRGDQGAPKVSVSADLTMKVPEKYQHEVSGDQLLSLSNEARKNAGLFTSLNKQSYIDQYLNPDRDPYIYPYNDWYDIMMKDMSLESNIRANISGGTDFVRHFTSLTYTGQGDVFKTDKSMGFYDPTAHYDKYNFRTNLDFFITKTTKLSSDISGRMEYTNAPAVQLNEDDYGSFYKQIAIASPISFPLYYSKEFIEAHPDKIEPWDGNIRWGESDIDLQQNPYRLYNYSGFNKYRKSVLDVTFTLNQDLSFITKGLKIAGTYNLSSTYNYSKNYSYSVDTYVYRPDSQEWFKKNSNPNTRPVGFHPSAGESFSSTARNIFYEAKIIYSRTFSKKHNVGALAVFNRSEKRPGLTTFPYYHEDWVGRVTYDYNGKYIFEANGSYNGSEKFAPGKRFGFFPSCAVGWNVAKEKFMKKSLPWINNFKLRYSYGKTGSENGERFMYQGGWGRPSNSTTSIAFGIPSSSIAGAYGEVKIANPDATWETAYTHNIGLDAKFFNKLTLNVNLFSEHREGIFLNEPLVSYYQSGVGSIVKTTNVKVNKGKTKRHGIEIEMNYNQKVNNDFNYSFGGNIAMNENRVIYKADRPFAPEYQKAAGKPISYNTIHHTNGLMGSFEDLINSQTSSMPTNKTPGGFVFMDYNADGRIDNNDRVPAKSSQPLFTYGFNVNFGYKSWNLSARFFGKYDCYYMARSEYVFADFNGERILAYKSQLDRWTPTNLNAKIPALVYGIENSYFNTSTDFLSRDCSYLRLQNLSLSYNFNSKWLQQNAHLQNLSLRVTGQNLLTFSKLKYGDPEGGNGLRFYYPLAKRIICSLNVQF